ncbi:MAG: hypothetical protein ABI986_08840 [Chloroflexota bacterium]
MLGNIIQISNMDKHAILVKVQEMNIDLFKIIDEGFFEPRHLGNTVLVGLSNGKPVFVDTPCYIPQIRMFALRNGNWLNFMIPMKNISRQDIPTDHYFLEFIPFMTNTTKVVVDTIKKFYDLWN